MERHDFAVVTYDSKNIAPLLTIVSPESDSPGTPGNRALLSLCYLPSTFLNGGQQTVGSADSEAAASVASEPMRSPVPRVVTRGSGQGQKTAEGVPALA